jgi:hypothetical protein
MLGKATQQQSFQVLHWYFEWLIPTTSRKQPHNDKSNYNKEQNQGPAPEGTSLTECLMHLEALNKARWQKADG